MAYLEIKNFYKSFSGFEVLKGVDFSLEKGEVLSIIGSSGSGKTTLLRCINFLETPDKGVLTLDNNTLLDTSEGFDTSDAVLRKKRLNFGLVFQSFNLFPQYSVFKNITLAPTLLAKDEVENYKKELKLKVKAKEISRKTAKELAVKCLKEKKTKIKKEATELLEKVGLSDKSYSYPCELSGGQSQRVAIARALALKPKILCFDEPTSALDPELTGEVLKVIKSLKAKDRTMIIVTHEMGFAQKVSDKVLFMNNGVVGEIGSPKEIFENPKTDALKNFLKHVNDKDI